MIWFGNLTNLCSWSDLGLSLKFDTNDLFLTCLGHSLKFDTTDFFWDLIWTILWSLTLLVYSWPELDHSLKFGATVFSFPDLGHSVRFVTTNLFLFWLTTNLFLPWFGPFSEIWYYWLAFGGHSGCFSDLFLPWFQHSLRFYISELNLWSMKQFISYLYSNKCHILARFWLMFCMHMVKVIYIFLEVHS